MFDIDDTDALFGGAIGAVSASDRLDDALSALASVFSPSIAVSRISVRTYDAVDEILVVDGLWTLAPTDVGVGTRLPARSTSFPEVERAGRAVVARWREPTAASDTSLLDRVIRDEGHRSWVVIPLRRERLLAGLLTICTAEPDAFGASDLPFFDALGEAVADRLLALAAEARGPSSTPR